MLFEYFQFHYEFRFYMLDGYDWREHTAYTPPYKPCKLLECKVLHTKAREYYERRFERKITVRETKKARLLQPRSLHVRKKVWRKKNEKTFVNKRQGQSKAD